MAYPIQGGTPLFFFFNILEFACGLVWVFQLRTGSEVQQPTGKDEAVPVFPPRGPSVM